MALRMTNRVVSTRSILLDKVQFVKMRVQSELQEVLIIVNISEKPFKDLDITVN